MTVSIFQDDDLGYREWVGENSDGFVVNIPRSLNAAEARVHRASCRTINGEPTRGATWTGEYIKVCSDSRTGFDAWARARSLGAITACGTCNP